MKKTVPVYDNWLFKKNFDSTCLEPDFEWGKFQVIDIPHNNIELDYDYFDAASMHFVSTYSRILVIGEKYAGCKFSLRFDGISSYAEVYVNGIFVTSHKGDTPFKADITAPVKLDYENRIVIKVDGSIRKDIPSSGENSSVIAYGGIHRNVFLEVDSGESVDDIYITTDTVGAVTSVQAEIKLLDYYPDAILETSILDAEGETAAKLEDKAVLSDKMTVKANVEGLREWSTVSPYLYTLRVRLVKNGKQLDCVDTIFGVRNIEFRPGGFYLNGTKLKLIGLNRVDSYPYVGRAMPESGQRADARFIREVLGCNVVRTLGLASPDFIDECDKCGLLVIEDSAGDSFIGGADWREAFIANIRDMVLRDRKHPSVIAWGVRVNNSRDCDELYYKTNNAARELDNRPTLGARDFMSSRLYEDIFAFNNYPEGEAIARIRKTPRLFVPYIISEHGGFTYPVKPFDSEKRRLRQAKRHLSVLEGTLRSSSICGAMGMSFTDFNTSPMRGSGDSVCYYGVCDMFRNPKLVAYAYAAELSNNAVLEVSTNLAADEYVGETVVFTNCDYVKLYLGEEYVGTYYPDRKKYKKLAHPPVRIKDLAGELPMAKENMTANDAAIFKKLLYKLRRNSIFQLPFFYRLAARYLRFRLKLDEGQFIKLTDKYSNYNSGKRVFTVEGYIGEEKTAEKRFGISGEEGNKLTVSLVNPKLKIKNSYDIARFKLKATDRFNNILRYEFSPVSIETEGAVTLIGDGNISLKGGMTGFYVKSTGEGTGLVKVTSKFGESIYQVEVSHDTVEKL